MLIGTVLIIGVGLINHTTINIRFYFLLLVYLGGVLLLVLYICSAIPNPKTNLNVGVILLAVSVLLRRLRGVEVQHTSLGNQFLFFQRMGGIIQPSLLIALLLLLFFML